jgi:hypothetical protein
VRRSGVPLHALALAHIDSSWTYPGGGEYQGLLTEIDLTEEAAARDAEVAAWISVAQTVAAKRREPERKTGKHCNEPYECGFLAYCSSCVEPARYPVAWLPAIQTKALKGLIENQGIADLRDIPDDLLNERQLRVKACTLAGKTYFDAANAARDLAAYGLPAYFMDFETTQLAVPIWKGTRPYQQVPFQYSVHRLSRTGKLDHRVFLDISGNDPSRGFAESLLADCGERGPVFGYNIPFERSRLEELAGRFPRMRQALLALAERLVDLRPVAEQRFYDPRQRGTLGAEGRTAGRSARRRPCQSRRREGRRNGYGSLSRSDIAEYDRRAEGQAAARSFWTTASETPMGWSGYGSTWPVATTWSYSHGQAIRYLQHSADGAGTAAADTAQA